MRPWRWPRSRVRSSTGTWCQGRRAQRASSVGWLALTQNRSCLLAGDQELGDNRVGVQRVGGDHRAGQVQVGQQRLEGGDLARAPSTWRWARTTRVAWSIAASRWACRPSAARRAPRRVLPSTATARRRWSSWSGWSRSASHAPIAAASASGSTGSRKFVPAPHQLYTTRPTSPTRHNERTPGPCPAPSTAGAG
jgi:hypothetical protein